MPTVFEYMAVIIASAIAGWAPVYAVSCRMLAVGTNERDYSRQAAESRAMFHGVLAGAFAASCAVLLWSRYAS